MQSNTKTDSVVPTDIVICKSMEFGPRISRITRVTPSAVLANSNQFYGTASVVLSVRTVGSQHPPFLIMKEKSDLIHTTA